MPSICKEQTCGQKIRKGHYLCSVHWQASEEGIIDECPGCGRYKESRYPLCIECNSKSQAKTKAKPKMVKENQNSRRYDAVKASTFDERAALLEDDPKAKDKRLLFDQQEKKCVYCGNRYKYDELEIEHMIPKVEGGPDHFRNSQLACRSCNQAKGTMTDIEFRKKHVKYLPQEERTPADPPIDPQLLKASARPRNRWVRRK